MNRIIKLRKPNYHVGQLKMHISDASLAVRDIADEKSTDVLYSCFLTASFLVCQLRLEIHKLREGAPDVQSEPWQGWIRKKQKWLGVSFYILLKYNCYLI